MREIKFRAWDKENKEWIANGDPMDLYHSASANCFLFDNDDYDLPKDIEFVQFTGLKDKNGKEIYEGDILSTNTFKNLEGKDVEICAKVSWHPKSACFGLDGTVAPLFYADEMFEVIGNVWENPKLLTASVSDEARG